MIVRLDKWLQIACIFKTRAQATRACSLGKVKVNGQTAKPHRNPQLEDRIEVSIGDWNRIIVVKELRDKSVPKAVAKELYLDLSPPRPKLDPIDRIMRGAPEHRERGLGRPTKKDRRQIQDLKRPGH